ncbi:hemerythrin HHE cation-binding protein [Suicoccus acidiformans]|uniref:Hemerythrin HHE cation-binding protein n=1 Tax=Suicoccus acidiformans TaxID=2036206 RepID=A0A347WJ43_9LACT|nr:DUF438 domain-containing protein [Suicoccus acidiformans]AXY25100.1 hemerythrin HHE cation-binding protein [Suicoccus acidiformans]
MQNKRIDTLLNILMKLHEGTPPEEVQEEFNTHFASVSAMEVAMMEQELIGREDNPITFEDVLNLCNVHAKMFEGKIDETEADSIDHPGHPVRVFKDENLALRSTLLRIDNILKAMETMDTKDEDYPGVYQGLQYQWELLGQFDVHYERKEKLFFPKMEAAGHTAPPKVMWAKDDEIRSLFQEAGKILNELSVANMAAFQEAYATFRYEFEEMIFKEEAILLNILMEALTVKDWADIAQESSAYGYAIIKPSQVWEPEELAEPLKVAPQATTPPSQPEVAPASASPQSTNVAIETDKGTIRVSWEPKPELPPSNTLQFEQGHLSVEEVGLLLDHLPLEVTFVSAEDTFQYYNHMEDPEHMLFKRTNSQLGRNIEFCHPPQSWPKVSQLIEDLRNGRRDSESMWFERKDGRFVYVTYRAVRDKDGVYKGILETVQDIQPFRNLPTPMKTDLSEIE